MRVTNYMLDESSRKAGMTLNNQLLSGSMDEESTDDSVLSVLKDRKTGRALSDRPDYEKLQKAAESLQEAAGNFTKEKDSVFDKAKESGESGELLRQAETLVKNYNAVLKELDASKEERNAYYKKMLQEVTRMSEKSLGQIGISQAADGSLQIDRERLKAADVETLEKVLGPSGQFSTRLAFVADSVSEQAQANAESLSSRYDASGNLWSPSAGRYDFRR